MGPKRTRIYARPRQLAMGLARELTGDSFPEIGMAFGGRDHSTVMHACEKVVSLREQDPILMKIIKTYFVCYKVNLFFRVANCF